MPVKSGKKTKSIKETVKSKSLSNKTLLIVESPAKSKTINKYLGSKFIVEASVGHIKDLVKVRLGVDVENGFQPSYTTIKGKGDIIKNLKQLSSQVGSVMIATDPDREGEAIAWHIANEVKDKNPNIKRVLFNEITKSGIEKGISDPKELNNDLFMSQQARRVMDRLIGYKVSPFLSRAMLEKTTKALSAGRVQSVALRLISEREEDITGFVPIDYWNIYGNFLTENKDELKARLVSYLGENFKNPEGSAIALRGENQSEIDSKLKSLNYISSEMSSDELIEKINKEKYIIDEISKKKISKKPLSPFTTSLLQQEASKRLNFSNKKTMTIAQKLYEGVKFGTEGQIGLITYMRTDSVRTSPDAQQAAKEYIYRKFGEEYVPDTFNEFKSKSSNIQDAHEAIRPASLAYEPDEVKKKLSKDEADLYELIYNRFLASQMTPAKLEQTTVSISGGDFKFRATGTVVLFKGFMIAYEDTSESNGNGKDTNGMLPSGMAENQKMELLSSDGVQSSTKPKPRFTEASLVKELDELGIGRPSTYSQIVSTITDREYVELVNKSFRPTELGTDVNEILVKNFPDLFTVDFTADMESELDQIAYGDKSYTGVLTDFYDPFSRSLKHAEEHGDIPEIPCPECGSPMIIRVSRKGRFLGCSKYPDCTGTKPLPRPNGEKDESAKPQIAEGIFCENCGKPMVIREGKFGRFYGCSGYPECSTIQAITSDVKCPKCNEGSLVERYSPKSRKKFWGCSSYPKCDYLSNYEPLKENCASCNHEYLEIRFRKVGDGYDKYKMCPNCKEKYDFKE